ncbi:hypothetical protein C8A00DRAFT_29260 [Chaetomidium leptoderma]|uniref:Uncharacterized protein n=1 Tax=Chaetomidium leptoderma TaxID=669021 RepID=A0AAN6VWL4_9PEZI|nr:hypothetical protein C8A00DRAFT_29260 [Chaetomidium leptoderma]
MMSNKHAPGATQADSTKPSIATLPYEIQVAIFEAAMDPQVFFMDITNDILTFSRPADKALGLACQLSREIYLKSKTLYEFGDQFHWLDPGRDIFYLSRDDPVPRAQRPNYLDIKLPGGDKFDRRVVQNVALDLQYMGHHPRHDAIVRVWTVFPHIRTIHILVPKGPPQTPALQSTPDTLALSAIPSTQVVALPGHDNELWLAVRYQVKKVSTRILDTENGWHGRCTLDVVGHFTSLRGTPQRQLGSIDGEEH